MPKDDSITPIFTSGSWNRGGHVFCRGKLFARAYAPEFTAQSGEEHRRAEMIADALNAAYEERLPRYSRTDQPFRADGTRVLWGGVEIGQGLSPGGAARIAEALAATQEFPWVGAGPTLAEAGGKSILVRLPDGGDLVRAIRVAGGRWLGPTGGILEEFYHGAGWLPTGWRPMPKAPRTVGVDPPAGPAEAETVAPERWYVSSVPPHFTPASAFSVNDAVDQWNGVDPFEDAEPYRTPDGFLCALCDLSVKHAHPQKRCRFCGEVGLAENMTVTRHRCPTLSPKE